MKGWSCSREIQVTCLLVLQIRNSRLLYGGVLDGVSTVTVEGATLDTSHAEGMSAHSERSSQSRRRFQLAMISAESMGTGTPEVKCHPKSKHPA